MYKGEYNNYYYSISIAHIMYLHTGPYIGPVAADLREVIITIVHYAKHVRNAH